MAAMPDATPDRPYAVCAPEKDKVSEWLKWLARSAPSSTCNPGFESHQCLYICHDGHKNCYLHATKASYITVSPAHTAVWATLTLSLPGY